MQVKAFRVLNKPMEIFTFSTSPTRATSRSSSLEIFANVCSGYELVETDTESEAGE